MEISLSDPNDDKKTSNIMNLWEKIFERKNLWEIVIDDTKKRVFAYIRFCYFPEINLKNLFSFTWFRIMIALLGAT